MAEFRIRDKLQEIYQLFEVQAQMKNITMRIEVDEGVSEYIYSDPNRITQILNNLTSNAIKFTPSGGSVEIFARRGICDENIYLEVRDHGCGMSSDIIQTLFTDFVSKSKTTLSPDFRSNPTGMGIGLGISYNLVKLLGGEGIQVESEPGKGSCFSFEIPISIKDNNYTLDLSPISPKRHTTFTSLERITREVIVMKCTCRNVLIVDDNMYNILSLKAQLVNYNLNFLKAFDGQEAVDLIENLENKIKGCGSDICQRIKIIFMDYEMPQLNGLKATAMIRDILKRKEVPEIPIVLNTAHNDAETKAEALKVGIEMFVSKPSSTAQLKEILTALL
eukprot:TRINITY_DN3705_c0_g1_i5.p1 TRINITY_DN3705_c0_g1~~TRINITY_DN3705_c0_g1_i5.p1  ORF type:complete len:334 (-),score=40.07 TRINITY_DN3705_c0_g1_i5:94-1095(-)